MNSSDSKFHKRIFSVHEQGAGVRQVCPNFNYSVTKGELIGHGSMHPSPLCNRYRFTLSYRVGENPKVTIMGPRLRCRADQSDIPHTYGPDEPCLFRPGVDWSESVSIGTTVIPWLATWLFYYEIWHATGEWHGGGVHPEVAASTAIAKEPTTEEKEDV